MFKFYKTIQYTIKQWLKNKSIKGKINIIYIILIVGQMFILANAASYISTKAIVRKTIKHSNESSRLVMLNIENILENTESYTNDLTVRVNNYFIDNEEDTSDNYYTNIILKRIFRNTLYVYPRIYGVLFILPDNRIFASDDVKVYQNREVIIDEFGMQKYNDRQSNIWLGMKKNLYLPDNEDPYVLTLCKKIVNINSGEYIGLLVVMTSENTFSDIYNNLGMGQTGRYFICDENGVVVSSTDKSELLKPIGNKVLKHWVLDNNKANQIITINGKKTLVTSLDFPKLNWKLIGMVPLSDITQESKEIRMLIIIIGVICIITAILLSNVLSSSITKPLYRLITEVKELQLHNLDVPTQINSQDDIGILAKNFDNMKIRISDLMTKVLMEQEKQKKYELKLLQAQIKPHFLYNTLQLIYSMIDMNKKNEAQRATKALADYYRIALSSGNEIISIEQEIKNVEDYLSIHKIRYADLFNYHIDVPEEIRKCKILKLTLQPIVENCIKHGFQNKKKKDGYIGIKASMKDNGITLSIEDNGIGMKAERVQDLFNSTMKAKNDSFGLINIDEKIKLFYGYEYGIKVRSDYMIGTRVSIYIPTLDDSYEDL